MIRKLKKGNNLYKADQPYRFKQKKQPFWIRSLLNPKIFSLLLFFLGLIWLSQSNSEQYFFLQARSFGETSLKISGLVVKNISIIGANKTSILALKKILSSSKHYPSIFSINVEALKNKIEKFPWVQQVSVKRRWPNTLIISLIEKKALALWQNNSKLTLIDTKGTQIAVRNLKPFKHFPLVVGKNANKKAFYLFETLSKTPYLRKLVKSASFIYNRRWNLNLSTGIVVQLPEANWAEAIISLEDLNKKSKLLKKDIKFVDMRVPPQIVLRLKSETAKRYKTINSPSLKKRPRSA